MNTYNNDPVLTMASGLDGLLAELARPGEILLGALHAESTGYARFNGGRLRQSGQTEQLDLTLTLIAQDRELAMDLRLPSGPALRATLEGALGELRELQCELPPDPYLTLPGPVQRSWKVAEGDADALGVTREVLQQAQGLDFVGILAAGPMVDGFFSSQGHSLLRRTVSCHLDYSLYLTGDKAVKSSLSGLKLAPADLERSLGAAREQLELLRRPACTVAPGLHDVYLSPAALHEFFDMLNWGGYSAEARRSGASSLGWLAEGRARFSEAIHLSECPGAGLGAHFQERGYLRPERIELIQAGRSAGELVSPRTAREYGLASNGASASEGCDSLQLAGGDLPSQEALARLGDGLWINNLWYLNYSDRPSCRMTGMTRFACFTVRGGEVQGPLSVMRFDDSFYDLLGSKLEALSRERQLLVDSGSYFRRSASSMLLPGALIRGMRFTL